LAAEEARLSDLGHQAINPRYDPSLFLQWRQGDFNGKKSFLL
jgi:hypothetical protein